MSQKILETLKNNKLREEILHHDFFKMLRTQPLLKNQVAFFLGQYWHPLHYFPTFLANVVAVVSSLELKTPITKILWQETGEGQLEQAHERLYIKTMTNAGFALEIVTQSPPCDSTQKLILGYQEASAEASSGLGFVYGTEVIDLAIVSGLGLAVQKITERKNLPWVDIHVKQEPDHIQCVSTGVEYRFKDQEKEVIITSAEKMWMLWIGFFNKLKEQCL